MNIPAYGLFSPHYGTVEIRPNANGYYLQSPIQDVSGITQQGKDLSIQHGEADPKTTKVIRLDEYDPEGSDNDITVTTEEELGSINLGGSNSPKIALVKMNDGSFQFLTTSMLIREKSVSNRSELVKTLWSSTDAKLASFAAYLLQNPNGLPKADTKIQVVPIFGRLLSLPEKPEIDESIESETLNELDKEFLKRILGVKFSLKAPMLPMLDKGQPLSGDLIPDPRLYLKINPQYTNQFIQAVKSRKIPNIINKKFFRFQAPIKITRDRSDKITSPLPKSIGSPNQQSVYQILHKLNSLDYSKPTAIKDKDIYRLEYLRYNFGLKVVNNQFELADSKDNSVVIPASTVKSSPSAPSRPTIDSKVIQATKLQDKAIGLNEHGGYTYQDAPFLPGSNHLLEFFATSHYIAEGKVHIVKENLDEFARQYPHVPLTQIEELSASEFTQGYIKAHKASFKTTSEALAQLTSKGIQIIGGMIKYPLTIQTEDSDTLHYSEYHSKGFSRIILPYPLIDVSLQEDTGSGDYKDLVFKYQTPTKIIERKVARYTNTAKESVFFSFTTPDTNTLDIKINGRWFHSWMPHLYKPNQGIIEILNRYISNSGITSVIHRYYILAAHLVAKGFAKYNNKGALLRIPNKRIKYTVESSNPEVDRATMANINRINNTNHSVPPETITINSDQYTLNREHRISGCIYSNAMKKVGLFIRYDGYSIVRPEYSTYSDDDAPTITNVSKLGDLLMPSNLKKSLASSVLSPSGIQVSEREGGPTGFKIGENTYRISISDDLSKITLEKTNQPKRKSTFRKSTEARAQIEALNSMRVISTEQITQLHSKLTNLGLIEAGDLIPGRVEIDGMTFILDASGITTKGISYKAGDFSLNIPLSNAKPTITFTTTIDGKTEVHHLEVDQKHNFSKLRFIIANHPKRLEIQKKLGQIRGVSNLNKTQWLLPLVSIGKRNISVDYTKGRPKPYLIWYKGANNKSDGDWISFATQQELIEHVTKLANPPTSST